MKKRLFSVVLAAVITYLCVMPVFGDSSICFVGINDSVPMYLSSEEAPYYKGNLLYVPYTVFQASPGGIAVSCNIDKGSLVLFTRAKRLVYDLNAGTITDELQKVSNVSVVFRNGILFIPVAKAATHFGLTATMLTSASGSAVLRFTDGGQTLDNTTFIRKAETLISMILDMEEADSTSNQEQQGTDTEKDTETDIGPATVYLAFAGEAVSYQTVETLQSMQVTAGFFLTLEQIEQNPDLVREIYAKGHHIGLTVSESDDYATALQIANQALDRVLFLKSVTALLPAGITIDDGYVVYQDPETAVRIEDILRNSEKPQLFICHTDAEYVLQRVLQEGAFTPKICETSYIP